MLLPTALLALGASLLVQGAIVDPKVLDACPGYFATNVQTTESTLTADLELAGKACNVFGEDIKSLKLQVEYETNTRIHVKITDVSKERFEIPESVFSRPTGYTAVPSKEAEIVFDYTKSPFSFTIKRTKTKEVLFSTVGSPIIFEPQYLRLKTTLPKNANIYGLGEHTDSFRLPTKNFTRTMWSRDSFGIPQGTNLYGSHPVYYDHRRTGTHGVFLLNANGMDIKIDESSKGTTLEYNIIGGIFDLYFFAGSENDPASVTRQYAEVAGTPAEVPYWGLGFHQCRFGYKDFVEVANVITEYAEAGIPLETMWTDIDYMMDRLIFTVDPDYFPMNRMREIVAYLHEHKQHYIVMVDPAVGYTLNKGYATLDRGLEQDVFLKEANNTPSLGLVWPGVTTYPDWFAENTQEWWTNEFTSFFNPETGLDVSGIWIDMNEPASFCNFPCDDPFEQAKNQSLPPVRNTKPPARDAPIFGRSSAQPVKRAAQENLLFPPYAIENAAGGISNKTAHTDIVHANGLTEYNVHNLYGTMMSKATRTAMAARRPTERTFIITRSTFAGAGKGVGKWLGDNLSSWEQYRFSIAGMLGFASIYQVPMVGSDICGFGDNTTETLCARWATLGAFYPFMRNHNIDTGNPQEFYLWPSVAIAAKNAIDIRYRLLDYIYTSFHQANVDGSPVLSPLFYKYSKDRRTYDVEHQFFYGDSILVSPVTQENSTTVSIYLPDDNFYDFQTLKLIKGAAGKNVILKDVAFTDIPLHIRGGAVLPLRVRSAMTTAEVRKMDFELIVAPSKTGTADGKLYLDDGVSLVQPATSEMQFTYTRGKLIVGGTFGYKTSVKFARVRFLGVSKSPKSVQVGGSAAKWSYDKKTSVLDVTVELALEKGFEVEYKL